MGENAHRRRIIEDPEWTLDELRALASVRGSALHKPLSRVLTAMRNLSQASLLDDATDFATTQYHRGRLRVIADLVALLEEEAPRRYEEARQSDAERKQKESST